MKSCLNCDCPPGGQNIRDKHCRRSENEQTSLKLISVERLKSMHGTWRQTGSKGADILVLGHRFLGHADTGGKHVGTCHFPPIFLLFFRFTTTVSRRSSSRFAGGDISMRLK